MAGNTHTISVKYCMDRIEAKVHIGGSRMIRSYGKPGGVKGWSGISENSLNQHKVDVSDCDKSGESPIYQHTFCEEE